MYVCFTDGDLGFYGTALAAFMKQKHRMIWERRHGTRKHFISTFCVNNMLCYDKYVLLITCRFFPIPGKIGSGRKDLQSANDTAEN